MKDKITNRGITIIELLLVISITTILSAASVPIASNFLVRNYFRDGKDNLVSQLYTAKINSMTNKENSPWGVNTSAHQITVFKGTSYATRDTAFDRSFDTPNSITISSNEIIFAQHSGNLTSATSITVNSNLNESNTVNVNLVGNIDVN
ncbi:MAG: hypothetical protein OEX81_05800 [Candidatus Pacebacteria bacterium]|nr:hypothetical protein [Candidatus Paceibacterota bacterium]